jgi:hypothetical protein
MNPSQLSIRKKEEPMPEELPLACSLSGADLKERLAEISEVGRTGLLQVETKDGTAVLRFRAAEGMPDRLAKIVAAESECCAFLEMKVENRDGSLELSIGGPEGSEPVIEELVEAFTRPAKASG